MDPAEQCTIDRIEGQSPSAAVCGEAGKDHSLHDQREISDLARSGSNLGSPGLCLDPVEEFL